VFESGVSFDLVVRLDESARADVERVSMLPVETPNGSVVPIGTVGASSPTAAGPTGYWRLKRCV
jgi:Cu/Ag efflux pump CusA